MTGWPFPRQPLSTSTTRSKQGPSFPPIIMKCRLPCVKNYQVLVEEKQGRIVFLYTIARGGTDRSYGINVARMAGVPRTVVQRALQLLGRWELPQQVPGQMLLHELILDEAAAAEEEQNEILAKLAELNINELTPLQALTILADWQSQLNGGDKG